MANISKAQQLFDELLTRYGRDIAEAFQSAIADLRSQADLQRAIAAIQAGNVDAAIAAMHLDAAAFNGLLDALRATYTAGGQSATAAMPAIRDSAGHAVVIRFDGRNYRAEAWLRDHSASLVTRVIDDQKVAIRQALTAGMEKGQNPRTVALDIVGRIDKATGKRAGGILGLTSAQEQYARSAAEELASGDPVALRNYLARSRRDRRFDRTIQKAIDSGQPVPADIAAKAVRNYKNRLLQLRGEQLGANEAFTSLEASKLEAHKQLIDTGAVAGSAVKKKWRHFVNEHPRTQHIAISGQTVGLDEKFTLPDGAQMLYPHDPSAPASQIVGCHCQSDYVVDYFAGLD